MPDGNPTARDVANAAGVSVAAVSYVFNGRPNRRSAVGDDTRRKVMAAAERLGYAPNHLARGLRRQRSNVVCVIRETTSIPSTDLLIQQIYSAADERDYSVVSLLVESADRLRHAFGLLQQRMADGAVVLPLPFPLPEGELTALAKRGQALTVFDERLQPDGFDVIRQGEADACTAAVAHLLAKGHQRIAFLDNHDHAAGAQPSSLRYAGYRGAHRAARVEMNSSLLTGANSWPDAYRATRAQLDRANRPTAIFAASDRAALAAIWACRDAGLNVPADIAVVGVGNLPEGEVLQPTLTTVGPEKTDFSSSIERLFARIDNPDTSTGEVISRPWRLIVRESS